MRALPGKTIPKMTYYVLSGMLNFYSVTHFLWDNTTENVQMISFTNIYNIIRNNWWWKQNNM